MRGARIFVAIAFLILGASFIASTALFINEFKDAQWFTLLVAHSHLFLFFPILGLLALFAFYLPSVVFTDLYWNHLPYGKLRYFGGLLVVAGLSYGVLWYLDDKPRSIWEVSPQALAADRGEPAGCGGTGGPACARAPVLEVMTSLRDAAQRRVGVSKFARNCSADPLLEGPDDMQRVRYCFPAKALLQGEPCCKVQERFSEAVAKMQADPAQRSRTAALDVYFLPLKVFFVLIVVTIGALLAGWRNRIDALYPDMVPSLERGVIIGAFAMLFWPLMDYGYQQTANVLFGRWGEGPQFRLSLVVAPWALLLLFYFLRRFGKNLSTIGQGAGVAASAVAVLRYEELNDWSVRLLGTGTNAYVIGIMAAFLVVGVVGLLATRRGDNRMAAAE